MAGKPLPPEVRTMRYKLSKIVAKWAEAAQEWLPEHKKIDQVIIARYMLWVYGKAGQNAPPIPYSIKLKALDRIAEMRGLLKPQDREGDYEKLLRSIVKDKKELPISDDEFVDLPDEILPRA